MYFQTTNIAFRVKGPWLWSHTFLQCGRKTREKHTEIINFFPVHYSLTIVYTTRAIWLRHFVPQLSVRCCWHGKHGVCQACARRWSWLQKAGFTALSFSLSPCLLIRFAFFFQSSSTIKCKLLALSNCYISGTFAGVEGGWITGLGVRSSAQRTETTLDPTFPNQVMIHLQPAIFKPLN